MCSASTLRVRLPDAQPAHATVPHESLSSPTSCALLLADVHANITTLEHGASPAAANTMLNLAALYMPVNVTALRAHTPRVWPPHRQAPSHLALPWGTCGPRGSTWFEQVRDGSALCVADGTAVHVVSHCYDFFWCHLMQERPSAWYDLLPKLQAAAGIAAAAAAAAPPQAAVAATATGTTAADLLALRPDAIHVALHMRTVKRRRLKNAYYGTLVAALRRRHTRYLSAATTSTSAPPLSDSFAAKPELQIWIHTDHDMPSPTSGTSECAGIICGLARVTGVRVVTPSMLRVGRAAAATSPLLVMRQLAAMDLLVPAVSSLSIVPALLSNTSVLFLGNGTCSGRASLPHWHVLPCSGNATEVERVIGAMPWPPPRAAARFEHASAFSA